MPWSWLEAVVLLAAMWLLAPLVGQLLVALFPPAFGQALAFPVLLLILGVLTVSYVRIFHPGAVSRLLGPGRFHPKELAVGVAHGVVAFLVINLGFALLISLLAALVGGELPTVQEGIREQATHPEHSAYVLASIVLVAPFAEELFFRGMLFQALRQRVGLWPGIGLSAVVFGLAHYEPGNIEGTLYAFLVLTSLGMYMAWVLHRRGHLAATITMHATFNAIAAAGILTGLA